MQTTKQSGFSLIELLIAVAIIAILAGIAYPNYRDYVTRGKLVDATSTLSAWRIQMEQYFQDNRTYLDNPVTNPGALAPLPVATKEFTFAFAARATNSYTLSAVGNAGNGDVSLFTFTLDSANVKTTQTTATGWNNSGACWLTRKGQSTC